MALLTAAQARNLLVVDPATGLQIEHVKAADPDRCWLEIYTVNKCEPGHEAIFQKGDGSMEYRDWTPVVVRAMDGSGQTYLTHDRIGDYDLVNKATGEVVTEARLKAPEED